MAFGAAGVSSLLTAGHEPRAMVTDISDLRETRSEVEDNLKIYGRKLNLPSAPKCEWTKLLHLICFEGTAQHSNRGGLHTQLFQDLFV
jgi:hypothetical protein